jgi:hypothetical protein
MTNTLEFLDIFGCIFFALTFLYGLHITTKITDTNFLEGIHDPSRVKMYKMIGSQRYKTLSLILLLSCIFALLHRKASSHNTLIVVIGFVVLSLLILLQTYYTFRIKKK